MESFKPRNVYIIGAHCTGKTTLIEALKEHLTSSVICKPFGNGIDGPVFVDEVVRKVMQRYQFSASDVRDPKEGLRLQGITLITQYETEDMIKNRWIVSDRSGFDCIVYAEVFLGTNSAERIAKKWEELGLRDRMQNALVVVCEPGNQTWLSSDNVRVACRDLAEWKSINDVFRSRLEQYGIRYKVLPGNLEDLNERVRFVTNLLMGS